MKTGQGAQVEYQKGAGGGQGRPENCRSQDPPHFVDTAVRSVPGLLIEHERVVDRQTQEDRGKPQTHHVERAEQPSAQGQGPGQNKAQHPQQPQERPPVTMGDPEQQTDDQPGPDHRVANVPFHAACHLRYKRWTSGVTNLNVAPKVAPKEPRRDEFLHLVQPGCRVRVTAGRSGRAHEQHAKGPARRSKTSVRQVEVTLPKAGPGQQSQAVGIIPQTADLLGRQARGQRLEGGFQSGWAVLRRQAAGEFGHGLGRLVQPGRGH